MTDPSPDQAADRPHDLLGRTVVVLGGSSGIGLETARLAVHLMTNSALTGATYDIDGGQQLLSNRGGTR